MSRAEAAAAGYSGSYGNDTAADLEKESLLTSGAIAGAGANGGVGALARRSVEYTRSGQVLGAGGDAGTRSRSPGVSGQVRYRLASFCGSVGASFPSRAERCSSGSC